MIYVHVVPIKKYKKCCMNKKEVSGLAGDQKITFK